MRIGLICLLAGCGSAGSATDAAGPGPDAPDGPGETVPDGPRPDLLGSSCERESDCPEGLACRIERVDDGDGVPESVVASCLPENDAAGGTGDACTSDDGCRTGICQLGRCAEVCTEGSCPDGFSCNEVSSLPGGVLGPLGECGNVAQATRFFACLPSDGVLDVALPDVPSGEWVGVDVPSQAASITMIARTDVDEAFVGVTALRAPDGSPLYDLPQTQEEFLAQPIRYFPTDRISTMLVPNTPDIAFRRGTHCFQLFCDAGGTVHVAARIKLAAGGRPGGGNLAIEVHILNLSGMGCGVDGLTAATAATHPLMQETVAGMGAIFAQAGVALGPIAYHDILSRPDLDVIDYLDGPDGDGVYEELNALLSAGAGSGETVDVFLVRHIEGKLGVSGSIPGPPGVHATPHAGVAVSMEAPCTTSLAKTIAHEIGHHLGLFHNIDSDGPDPIQDTDEWLDNLMYAPSRGTDLTRGQSFVLRANPLVR